MSCLYAEDLFPLIDVSMSYKQLNMGNITVHMCPDCRHFGQFVVSIYEYY